MSKQDNFRIIDGNKYYRVTTIIGDTLKSEGLLNWAKTRGIKIAKAFISAMPQDKYAEWKEQQTQESFLSWLDALLTTPDAERDRAGDLGTAVHDKIFEYLSGHEVKVDEGNPLYIPITEFIKWASSVSLRTDDQLFEEQLVYKPDCLQVKTDCKAVANGKCTRADGEACKWYSCGYTGKLDYLNYVNGKRVIMDWKTGKHIYLSAMIQVSAYWKAWNEMHSSSPVEECYIVRIDKEKAIPPEIMCIQAKSLPELFNSFLALKRVWELMQKTSGKKRLALWAENNNKQI